MSEIDGCKEIEEESRRQASMGCHAEAKAV
jgi:hypothetical protein